MSVYKARLEELAAIMLAPPLSGVAGPALKSCIARDLCILCDVRF